MKKIPLTNVDPVNGLILYTPARAIRHDDKYNRKREREALHMVTHPVLV